MNAENEFLTEDQVQQIACKFLLDIYFDSKISFTGFQMIAIDGAQTYQLYGEITMRSRSLLGHFVLSPSANKFKFTIEIDAIRGKIISYEII